MIRRRVRIFGRITGATDPFFSECADYHPQVNRDSHRELTRLVVMLGMSRRFRTFRHNVVQICKVPGIKVLCLEPSQPGDAA